MKKLEEYKIEELKRLYKSYSLYIVTKWFRLYQKIHNTNEYRFFKIDNPDCYETAQWNRVFIGLKIKSINTDIDLGKYRSTAELNNMKCEKLALNICGEVLLYCTNRINELDEDAKERSLKELHEQDNVDKEYNRATKEEIYNFIWNTLRFCDIKELTGIIKSCDNQFQLKDNIYYHRPPNNKRIFKYDMCGNLIATFLNRADCIEKEGMTKSTLSKILTNINLKYKGYKYKEEVF